MNISQQWFDYYDVYHTGRCGLVSFEMKQAIRPRCHAKITYLRGLLHKLDFLE